MHLCEPCLSSRDWEADPVVQAKIAQNLQQTDENRKARCADCRTYIRNPLFRICAKCAHGADLCQFCTKSTISVEARAEREAAAERREELVDFFTLLMKTYGLTKSRELVAEARAIFGDAAVETMLLLGQSEMDNGRERRPIWTKALGPNVFRFRWCPECSATPRRAPAIVKAAFCDHYTTARSPANCPVCAADKQVCEGCGIASD